MGFIMFILIVQLLSVSFAQSNFGTCVHRVANCSSSVDYFPSKVQFKFSGSVKSVIYSNTYVQIHQAWNAWSGTHDQKMVFVRCGCPSPNLGAGWIETFVPVRSISVHETVAVPKVYMLGQRAKMIASDSISFATTEELLDDVRDGSVLDIRGNFSRMIEANAVPDVLLTGSGPFSAASGFSLYPILSQRRILDADPGESSPLGRAELIKLTGMLFGAEDTADSIMNLVETQYMASKKRASIARRRPSVMLNTWQSWNGNWSIAKGSSYLGQFLKDANCEYRNSDDSLPSSLNMAQFTQNFGQADYWLNAAVFGARTTMDRIFNVNASRSAGGDRPFLASFPSVRCGEVYANDNLVGTRGNPFFELGVLRPDLILDDLVTILHSDQSSGRPLTFYQKVSPPASSLGIPPCPRTYFPNTPAVGQVYVFSKMRVSGMRPVQFLGMVHTGLKDAVAQYLNISTSEFELLVASEPPPTDSGFTVSVNVRHIQCVQTTLDCGIIPLGHKLLRVNETIISEMRKVTSSISVTRSATVEVLNSALEVVPLSTIEAAQPAPPLLSDGAIVGIALGCAAFVAIFVIIVAVIVHKQAYSKGEAHAYTQIGGRPPSSQDGSNI